MLVTGELFAERFEVLGLAGRGGMGTVCKAYDQATGEVVGLKVLNLRPGSETRRFQREAQVLAQLSHPAIVRHIAHGTAPDGAFYLVMEWLVGEDLASRLSHDGLGVRQSIALTRRVATALNVAHEQGIIHRDIKPANLFLVEGDPRQVKVLDFGIARPTLTSQGLTRTGAMVGTLGYIAPEQACGESTLDTRVDVFSLGCVLFECLTGEPAFHGVRPVAVLAKILFGETPHARELRPELPAELDAVVASMMAKERDERPRDAAAVVEALDHLDPLATAPPPGRGDVHQVLTGEEQRFLSVILIAMGGTQDLDDEDAFAPTSAEVPLTVIQAAAEPLGGQLTATGGGDVLITLKGSGTAKDLAARAATCALALRVAVPSAHICLATGPLELIGEWPAGRVFDRVATVQEGAASLATERVCVDDVTAALLGARFELAGEGPVRELLRARLTLGARQLLGQQTPFVGRDKELDFLENAFSDCADDPAATVVLVTGPAGSGKTRLAREFLERVRGCGGEVTCLIARGDPVYAGAAFGLASQLVRHAARLRPGDAPAAQHAVLRAALAQLFEGEALVRVAELLGELVQAPTTDTPSPRLLAARNDPRVKNEQLKAAFVDALGALCQQAPVVLVLDNLQWGDVPSVTFLHAALRRYAEAPVMVLGLARPDIVDTFPDLWSDVGLQRLGLSGLKRRASIELVRAVLGEDAPDELVSRAVEQAGGNAFFLEELIRHVAERGTADFPDSVLAMAQSRLEALAPDARRLLRGASIFGPVFWEDAVSTLLGAEVTAEDLPAWLDVLVKSELLDPSDVSRFPRHHEFAFRHELIREAAYSTLTDKDRRLGHLLAAEWLEAEGEPEALVIAEHFERGGLPERAIPYLVRAAQAAFDGGHLEAIGSIADRGLSYGATGEDRGQLLLMLGGRAVWQADFEHLGGNAREALSLLPYGSSGWFMALAGMAFAGSFGGDVPALLEVIETLQAFEGDLPPIAPVGYAAHALNASLIFMGRADEARAICSRLEDAIDRGTTPDPVFLAYRHLVRGWLSLNGLLDVGEAIPQISSALEQFEVAHSPLSLAAGLYGLAVAQWITGAFADCEATSQQVIELSRRRGVGLLERWAKWTLGIAVVFQGRYQEGIETLTGLLGSTDKVLAVSARLAVATTHLLADRIDEAAREAEATVRDAMPFPMRRAEVEAVLGEVARRRSRPDEAIDLARRCLERSRSVGAQPLFVAMAHLTMAEALDALGDAAAAREALAVARDHVLGQAATFEDEEQRALFLRALPTNARILELAAARLDAAQPIST